MVSYFGGMFGEFTCIQLSRDKNFYPINLKKVDNNNRYYCDNPLIGHFSNLKPFKFAPDVEPLSATTLEIINNQLVEKNLCFPTHFYAEDLDHRLNIPQLKTVRMVTEHQDILILGYCCQWIKSLVDVRQLESRNNRFIKEFESYVKTKEGQDLYDQIKLRTTFYWFEKVALKHQHTNLNEFIDYWWKWYQKFNDKRYQNWDYIDIGNCFKDYENSKDDWKNYFSLADHLDKNTLDSYYAGNLDLIQREFGITFDKFINSDWLSLLKEWVASSTNSVLK